MLKEIVNTIIVLGAIAMCITILYFNLDAFGEKEVSPLFVEDTQVISLSELEDFSLQVTGQGYLLCEDVDKNVFKLVPREEPNATSK